MGFVRVKRLFALETLFAGAFAKGVASAMDSEQARKMANNLVLQGLERLRMERM